MFHLWCFIFALAGLITFVSLTAGGTQGSPREVSILAVVSSIASLLCIRLVYPTRESSASFLFVLCFSLFNLGLAPFVALGIQAPSLGLGTYETSWLFSTVFPQAMAIATIGLLSLFVGTTFGRLLAKGEIRSRDNSTSAGMHDDLALKLGAFGTTLMGIAVLAFFAVALTHGGLKSFTSGYPSWLSATQNTPLPYVYALIGFGTGILAISSKSQARTMGFFFFVVYAAPALLIGLRAEVFFPIVSAIVMGAFRSRFLSGKRLIALLIVALLVISGIRSFRDVGFPGAAGSSDSTASVSFNALDGLAELGYSLRPTVVVLQWQQEGQPALDGGSFASPFVRLAHSTLPFLGPNTDAKSDPDILNSVILQRVGAIGFSQTAEAYDNWGTAGVIGVLLIIGLALAWIDCAPAKALSLLIRNSVFVPLLLEVRNTFTPVPAEVLLGLVVSLLVLAFVKREMTPSLPQTARGAPTDLRRPSQFASHR